MMSQPKAREPHRSGSPHASAPPTRSRTMPAVGSEITTLQRTVGNRALTGLLREGARVPGLSNSPVGTIRREIENDTYNTDDEEKIAAAKTYFSLVNAATQNAYQYVVMAPSLGPLAKLDGRTELWNRLWTEFASGGKPKMMAASFGYAVETLVSDPRSPYAAKVPSGYSVTTQFVSGGTRPDLVLHLKKGSLEVAWVDLTASKSADHIFAKESWDKKIAIFAEVTYPSLDPGTLALMYQNKDSTGPVDKAEFEKRMAIAKALHSKRKEHWWGIGAKLSYRALSGEIGRSKGEQQLDLDIPRRFIAEKLKETFGAERVPDQRMVPSILTALGVNSSPWGYTTGFNQSEKAGEAWLVDNDPSLPSG